jgi:uncharacterized membrane protein YphA (DoxX/SURF4 family)
MRSRPREDNVERTGETSIPRWPLVIPRIYVGIVFLAAGVGQLTASTDWTAGGQSWPQALHVQLTTWLAHSAVWYRPFITHFLLPRTDIIAPALGWIHVLLGIALIAGIGTRLAAAIVAVLLLNYAAAAGDALYGAAEPSAYLALVIAVWLGRAGRTWGVDAILARRQPEMVLG